MLKLGPNISRITLLDSYLLVLLVLESFQYCSIPWINRFSKCKYSWGQNYEFHAWYTFIHLSLLIPGASIAKTAHSQTLLCETQASSSMYCKAPSQNSLASGMWAAGLNVWALCCSGLHNRLPSTVSAPHVGNILLLEKRDAGKWTRYTVVSRELKMRSAGILPCLV